jgi:hypothetical protein
MAGGAFRYTSEGTGLGTKFVFHPVSPHRLLMQAWDSFPLLSSVPPLRVTVRLPLSAMPQLRRTHVTVQLKALLPLAFV